MFYYFILLTGIGSFIAAFGHLPILDIRLQNSFLLVSRIINIISIYCFAIGILKLFGYNNKKWLMLLNIGVFIIALSWLVYMNVFNPVMIYGVFGMLIVGLTSTLLNYDKNRQASGLIVAGLLVLATSAVVFAVYKNSDLLISAADIGHFLIAIAMILTSLGFNKLEIEKFEK
ncbi:hypothetical protein OAD66_03225 [Bacteroidia bacterium]|nr:hypothetical protein [Bacteroidia bacterium]